MHEVLSEDFLWDEEGEEEMTEVDLMKEIGEIVEELEDTERKIQELKKRVMMLQSPQTEDEHDKRVARSMVK